MAHNESIKMSKDTVEWIVTAVVGYLIGAGVTWIILTYICK